jgi:hypothetical protein
MTVAQNKYGESSLFFDFAHNDIKISAIGAKLKMSLRRKYLHEYLFNWPSDQQVLTIFLTNISLRIFINNLLCRIRITREANFCLFYCKKMAK